MATETTGPTLLEIEQARRRLKGVARLTPVYGSETFSRLIGRDVQLKAENLQRTGSFKVRGAVNRIATLSDSERAAGVVAASAGNHGQAVAWAAREAGIPALIYVPQDAPMAKVEACRNYAAKTELVGAAFEEALAAARAYADETGATFVHPYEDELVIAGQGTIGLELAEQVPSAETVLIPASPELRDYVATALDEQRRGVSLPFAIIDRATDEPIGSTRYGSIALADRRLEIGWTWYAVSHQRTAANTESKLLLLTHAFEHVGVVRVEFKTDALNAKSRAAIVRLGAVEEGTFRKHMQTVSGRVRDTVYFSILDTEWPAVKARLTSRLAHA